MPYIGACATFSRSYSCHLDDKFLEPTAKALDPEPWRGLSARVADLIEAEIPVTTAEILDSIGREVPEYARPLEGDFGRGVRTGVAQALTQFVAVIRDPDAGRGMGREVYLELGRGELRQGRTLDSLQAAYRVGARVAWRRFAAAGNRARPAGRLTQPARRVDLRLHRRDLGRLGRRLRRSAGRARGPGPPPPPRADPAAGRRRAGRRLPSSLQRRGPHTGPCRRASPRLPAPSSDLDARRPPAATRIAGGGGRRRRLPAAGGSGRARSVGLVAAGAREGGNRSGTADRAGGRRAVMVSGAEPARCGDGGTDRGARIGPRGRASGQAAAARRCSPDRSDRGTPARGVRRADRASHASGCRRRRWRTSGTAGMRWRWRRSCMSIRRRRGIGLRGCGSCWGISWMIRTGDLSWSWRCGLGLSEGSLLWGSWRGGGSGGPLQNAPPSAPLECFGEDHPTLPLRD